MKVEVKVPTPGESISEVELATWMVSTGDLVRKNQELAEIESDKATLSLIAPESGKIELLV
ncbi:MAG TPA: biotin/lipoyl-containing protein, partial [Marinilabiliaceae bacterium]|nr:biotin/lipoyl-containing protein [Marinilabiliaceae bacterium]